MVTEWTMAEYHLHAKTHSRGAGKGAGGHARYILRQGPYATKEAEQVDGSDIVEPRVSRADEVLHSESGNMPVWATDGKDYWDAADQYERANGTVYREIEFALPKELPDAVNILLAQDFAKRLATVPEGVTPYTLAIHRSEKDPSLLHCHLMLSDKVNDGIARDPELWFRRVAASRTPTKKGKDKKPVDPAKGGAKKTQARISQDWLGAVVRPLWAELANQELAHAGYSSRIDHRSLDAQREEAEQQAEQARERGDLAAYRKAREISARLDHPPEPKRGRVLEHAGPKKAPRQAAKVIDYEAAKAVRQQARAEMERMEAEAESARQVVEQAKAVLEAARERQQQRDFSEPSRIREKWQKRQQFRIDRALDAQTERETRNGCRDSNKPAWVAYRQRILTEAYGAELGRTLGRWVKVEQIKGSTPSLRIHNKVMDITDYGDRLVALQAASSPGGNAQEIEAMLKIAGAKGWKALTMTGSADFQMRAGAAALAAGFDLADKALADRIIQQQAKDAEAQRAKALEVAPVLGAWMHAHPKQAQAQRLASGKLPWTVPDGLDRQQLKNPDVWRAADAWVAGRHGKNWKALTKDSDPLIAQAAMAGHEAAQNAWAQGGLTLKIGKDAPGGPGANWHLTGKITRERVEQMAGYIRDRSQKAGVEHGITVTFGREISSYDKTLVMEHLLRHDLKLDNDALRTSGDTAERSDAYDRVRTLNDDGTQQDWYAEHMRRKQAEQQQKAAQRERENREADFKKRAEELGYEGIMTGMTPEEWAKQPVYLKFVADVGSDTDLIRLTEAAYRDGVARAQKELDPHGLRQGAKEINQNTGLGRGIIQAFETAIHGKDIPSRDYAKTALQLYSVEALKGAAKTSAEELAKAYLFLAHERGRVPEITPRQALEMAHEAKQQQQQQREAAARQPVRTPQPPTRNRGGPGMGF
jgi:hypothetical protein